MMDCPFQSLPVLHGCATLQLSRNLNTLIDAVDLAELARSKWFVMQTRRGGRLYAATDALAGGRPGRVALHRHLIGEPPGVLADHENGDGLDNRRRNLRPASPSQNVANSQKRRRGGWASSAYKGVAKHRGGRWAAGICRDRHRYYLGIFLVEAEAALAFNHAANLLFGEFARVNTIPAELAPPPARQVAIKREIERRLARTAAAA